MLMRIVNKFKRIVCAHSLALQKEDYEYLIDRYVNHAIPFYMEFNFNSLKKTTLSYVRKQRINETNEFLYSDSCNQPCIYNTCYAILTYSLFNEPLWSKNEEIKQYLDSFQQPDGFFVDSRISNSPYFPDGDWWGKKHLLPHVLMCYRAIGERPKYQLDFLEKIYDLDYFKTFCDALNFDDKTKDDDNKVMNIGCALQFQRDFFNDSRAEKSLDYLYNYLNGLINNITGSWGNIDISDVNELSRVQQVAYHLYILYLYDKKEIQYREKIIDLNLKLQSKFGAYNAGLIGSACTDIDVVFLFSELLKQTDYRKEDIIMSLKKALPWVLSNQNDDGGYVFRRNESFEYGSPLMFSKKNESNLFATWFRSACIAYICNSLNIDNEFKFIDSPGYQY